MPHVAVNTNHRAIVGARVDGDLVEDCAEPLAALALEDRLLGPAVRVGVPAPPPQAVAPQRGHGNEPVRDPDALGNGESRLPAAALELRSAPTPIEKRLPSVSLVLERVSNGGERKRLEPPMPFGVPQFGEGFAEGEEGGGLRAFGGREAPSEPRSPLAIEGPVPDVPAGTGQPVKLARLRRGSGQDPVAHGADGGGLAGGG